MYFAMWENTRLGNGRERRVVYIDKRVPTPEDETGSGETSRRMWEQVCTPYSSEVCFFLEGLAGEYDMFSDRTGEFSEFSI